MNGSLLQEAHKVDIVKPRGKKWEVVLIESGLSENGNNYSSRLLRNSLHLFKDLKACVYQYGTKFPNQTDHLPPALAKISSEFSGNVIGFYENVRYGKFKRPNGSKGEGILADLNILEGAEWLMDNLKELWESGKIGLFGLSIDAEGLSDNTIINGKHVSDVKKLEVVSSTDVVSDPAAGGGFLRMVASIGANDMNGMLDLIKKYRPSWLDGFAEPEDSQDKQDYLSRVIETNLVKARDESARIPIDEYQHLAEQDRGVKTLRKIFELLGEGKNEEAMAMLKEMLMSMEESADGQGKQYAYPYSTSNTIQPNDDNAEPARREAMDPENKPEPQDNPELVKRESELAQREADFKVREKVMESGLPEQARTRIQQLFTGKSGFSEEDITEAIESEKKYIASLTESEDGKPDGLGDAHDDPKKKDFKMTKESSEKIGKALDGMWANRDIDGIPRFKSLRTAYAVCNGGQAPPGWHNNEKMAKIILESMFLGFPDQLSLELDDPFLDPVVEHHNRLKENFSRMSSRRLREAVTTSDFSIAFGDSMFRRLQKEYDEDPNSDWRKIVSSIENLKDATNTFNVARIGHPTKTLPVVNENAPYQELTDPSEESTSLTPAKHGGLLKFTWEDVLADELNVLRQIPRKLARTGNRTVWEAVWDLINNNTVLTSDSVALIDTATHANRVSGDPALSFSDVVAAVQLLREQTELDTTARLGLMPKFLLVSIVNEALAHEITQSDVKVTAGEDATVDNVVKTLWGLEPFVSNGLGRLTANENKWYVTIDPRQGETITVGFLGGRDRPEMFVQGANTPTQGSFFDADAITFKSRLVFGVATVDFRWIVGSLTA